MRRRLALLLQNTKASKDGVEGVARQVRSWPPLKSTARDLKPDTHDDVGSEFHILHAETSPGYRFSEIRFEIGANALEGPVQRL